METIKDILLIALSTTTFYFAFRYRRKDFQITILKEQMSAYKSLGEILFHNAERLNDLYNETINLEFAMQDVAYMESVPSLQTHLYFEKFTPDLKKTFNGVQNMIYLLPDDVIVAVQAYFDFLDNLFLKENDLGLAKKLLEPLDQKVLDVVNAIRTHIGIDDLTLETRKMISKHPQLHFVSETPAFQYSTV